MRGWVMVGVRFKFCTALSPPHSLLPPSNLPLQVKQLTDEEFCDLQILLLEAGHKLSKAEQQ